MPQAPSSFDRDALRRAGRRAVDLFVDNFDGPPDARVYPECDRQSLRPLLADTITADGVGIEQAVDDFARLVLPNCMRTPHPLYLGLVNTSPLPGAVLGDLLVSTMNNNGGAFHQSPAMTMAEQEVLAWMAARFGLGDVQGMFLPGGSYSMVQALLLARAKHLPQWDAVGPAAVTQRPLIYCSSAAHFSVERAGHAAGLGREGVVAIPTVGRGAMDVAALAERIESDLRAGVRPFAVVATVGTTGTGAMDPVEPLADVCREHDLWLHVDACYGGGVLLLDEQPAQVCGIERADSLAVNPHKWFFIPLTASVLFTRHAELARSVFDVGASYIPGDGEVDAYRRGIPTSRRSTGFAMWMALRAHGWSVVRDTVVRNITLTRLLERLLAEAGFTVLPDGELSIACARWEPPGLDAAATDELQRRITNEVVAGGTVWFATVEHDGKTWLRFNMVNLHTREEHIERLVEELKRSAREAYELKS